MPKIIRRARKLIKNPEELIELLTQALGKAYAKRGVLYKIYGDFMLLFRLVRAWVQGEYRQVPRTTILWAVVAILYFLSPIDAIPDLLPGGFIDDIAMIAFILKRIKGDLDQFSGWEKIRDKENTDSR